MLCHADLARLSEKSYQNYNDIVLDDVEVYCCEFNKEYVVAFSGSVSVEDWIRNARAYPWYDNRIGWAHCGFLKGARSVVDSWLGDKVPATKPVTVTGHSLGGALAIVAGGLLDDLGLHVKRIVTFGAPRVLISGHNGYQDIDVFEYVYGNDIVPTVPWAIWGYRHFNRIQLGKRKPNRNWEDHDLGVYIARLDANGY